MKATTPSGPGMSQHNNADKQHGAAYRWRVASRVLAAALGGYAVTSLATALLARGLRALEGSSQAGAVLGATLFGFTLYTALVIWVFSTRSATRAWAGMALSALVLGLWLLALRMAA